MMALGGLVLFHFITFAYPFWPSIKKVYTDQELHNGTTELVGCNISRLKWCLDMTPPNVWLYFCAFAVFIGLCFPNINLSLGTLFSHIIGPRRQVGCIVHLASLKLYVGNPGKQQQCFVLNIELNASSKV